MAKAASVNMAKAASVSILLSAGEILEDPN